MEHNNHKEHKDVLSIGWDKLEENILEDLWEQKKEVRTMLMN